MLARGVIWYTFERGWKELRHNSHVYAKSLPESIFVDDASLGLVDL
jgi:hypothetical protein